jgi:hypothetical protein
LDLPKSCLTVSQSSHSWPNEPRISTCPVPKKPKAEIDYDRARIALMKSLIRQQVASRAQFAGRVGRQRMPPPQA